MVQCCISSVWAPGAVFVPIPRKSIPPFPGTGSGWAAAFGRIGAFSAPFIVPVIYNYYGTEIGYTNVFITLTLVFAVVAIVVAVFGKETMGKTLEEINKPMV